MDNKSFFEKHSVDVFEPHSGHEERFLRKLHQQKKSKKISFRWLSIAASITLIIGFYFGSIMQPKTLDLATIAPQHKETQDYFVSAIHQEMILLEKNRSLKTETIIEDALDRIEELEEKYVKIISEIKRNGNEKQMIKAMIENYQKRLAILEQTLQQIETIKNPIIKENYEEFI